MLQRSKDFDVRLALVQQLLREGVKREDIRHEITLNTASSDGRSDVVFIYNDMLYAAEIKSGSDRLKNLDVQEERNRCAFDYTAQIIDKMLDPKMSFYQAQYCHETKQFVEHTRGEYHSISDIEYERHRGLITYNFRQSYNTNIVSMSNVLWRDELMSICGAGFKSRTQCSAWLKEHGNLYDFRKRAIAQLRARHHSRWDRAFWKQFDEIITTKQMEAA